MDGKLGLFNSGTPGAVSIVWRSTDRRGLNANHIRISGLFWSSRRRTGLSDRIRPDWWIILRRQLNPQFACLAKVSF